MSQGGKKRDKNDYAKQVKEEAQKRAEAEAEKLRQEKAAEEARLSALREAEEAERRRAYNIAYASDEDKEKDLKAWLQTIPLSEPCVRRIDRDFSDGALLAEVIHYYCPQIVDKREFRRYCSKTNKLGNWDALNMKVFSKMGFRLNRKQINNLINPYSCGKFQKDCAKGIFMYKLLFHIRDILAETNAAVYTYRKQQSRTKQTPDFEYTDCFRKSKVFKRKLTNLLENPCYSRIEMLLESGFYDRKDAKPPIRRPACVYPCTSIEREKCCVDEKDNMKKCWEVEIQDDKGDANVTFFPCVTSACSISNVLCVKATLSEVRSFGVGSSCYT